MGESGATARVWAGLPAGARAAIESTLSPTDLQTLLLSVARARSSEVSPARVMERWRDDAFVRPSDVDPRRLAPLEAELWSRLPLEFEAVELSPVAPFGTCAAVAGVDQNRVLTTMRTSEVVSDPTVVLALEAARRRQRQDTVHLAASHRVLRTQRFPPGYSQHFRLMALVSSGRDTGSGRAEAAMLTKHLSYYVDALGALLPADTIRVHVTAFEPGAVSERVVDTVLPALGTTPANVELLDDPDRTRGHGYYRSVAVRIEVVRDGVGLELGDGGFTDWTARLRSDAKERCLTSCISTERLASLL